jgi:hypothetical protein
MTGWKDWTVGEVVTEPDFQSYIQDQVVQVYATSAARGSALGTAVSEGMVSYIQDTNAVEVYTGAGWDSIATGDISAVTAGTGLTGGGTSGSVTLNVNYAAVGSSIALAGTQITFGGTSVSTAFTATSALENGTILVTGTAAVTVTVPDVLNTWDSLNIIRDTSGTVTIAAGTGVTTWAGAGTAGTAVTFKIDQQYNGAQVIKVAANSYRVIGRIVV